MKFELDQDQFSKFKTSILIRTIPVLLLPLIGTLIFNYPGGSTAVFTIPVFLVLMAFVLRNSIKKQKKAWETFELIIDETKVERYQEGFPDISVNKSEIKEAIIAKNGAITLISIPKINSIIIPFSVQRKAELLEVISTFTTIKEAKNNNGLLLLYGSSILGLLLFFSFMFSNNFYLTMVTGVVLFALCLWGFITTQRSKHIDKKVKRSSFVIFILLIVILSRIVDTLNQF